MKKIWNDPVWSKVIAGSILGALSLLVAWLYQLFSLAPEERSIKNIDLTQNIEVNLYILITLTSFLIGIILVVIFVSKYKKYDVFFSAPMSSETDEEYKKVRDDCLKLITALKENANYKRVYFAAENIESISEFSAANHAVLDDLTALRKSKRFLLYMPNKVPTSAIFEAGYALRKNLPTAYLCHKSTDLPFLMRDLNDSFRLVRKYEAATVDQLCGYIKQCKNKFFSKSI